MFKLIFILLTLSTTSFADELILFDGESKPFSSTTKWDSNGSKLAANTIHPMSKPNHMRATIINKRYWGAVEYNFDNSKPINFSEFTTLSIAISSDSKVAAQIYLIDGVTLL